MPRPKVTNRKRILKACISCKRRKERCDGFHPCGRCKHRNRERECTFQYVTPSTPTGNTSNLADQPRRELLQGGGSSISHENHQDISRPVVPCGNASVSSATNSTSVQELPVRTLKDTHPPLSLVLQESFLSSAQSIWSGCNSRLPR